MTYTTLGGRGGFGDGRKSHDLADSGSFKRARDLTEPDALFSLSHESSGCVMGGLRRTHSLVGGTGAGATEERCGSGQRTLWDACAWKRASGLKGEREREK